MKNVQPTVSSVQDGLAKLIAEVRHLEIETRQLREAILGFTKDRTFPRRALWVKPEDGGGRPGARTNTEDPISHIEEARYDYVGNPNLEIPTRTLLAIARDLDGALRDIRAARSDIQAIADDSDLREDFKHWQREQGR